MNPRLKNLLKALGCLLLLSILASIFFPIPTRSRESARRASCQSNLKGIGLAFKQYAQDYNGKFPNIAYGENSAHFGWADALVPYLHSPTQRMIFQCPGEENNSQGLPRQSNYTDYWMNGRLSGLSRTSFEYSERTLLSGDGNSGADDTNARYSLESTSKEWYFHQTSPAYRHLDGANFLFADGHVKWFKGLQFKEKWLTAEITFFPHKQPQKKS